MRRESNVCHIQGSQDRTKRFLDISFLGLYCYLGLRCALVFVAEAVR